MGRFIQPDWYIQNPANPQDLNRYTYARNNPLKYTDPTGNFAFLIPFVVAAFVGAGVSVAIAAIQGNLTSKNFWQVAGIGALSGVVGYATGGAANGLLSGITGSGFITAVLSGAASGYVSNGAANLVQGRQFNDGGWRAAAIGGAAGGAGYLGGKLIERFKESNATKMRADAARLGLVEDANNRINQQIASTADDGFSDAAKTFRDGSYKKLTLQSDVQVTRYFDNIEAGDVGRYFTTKSTVRLISSPAEAQSVLRLYNNAATHSADFVIPKGTTVAIGRVAGGHAKATQVVLRKQDTNSVWRAPE